MKLVTWNVNARAAAGNGKQPEQARRLIAERPEVVALQEVTTTTLPLWRAALEPEGYRVVDSFALSANPGALRGRRRYGEVIASRFPVQPLRQDQFTLPWPERVLSVRLDADFGTVEIHNAHLPAGSSDRRDGTSTKVETFEGIATRLATRCDDAHRILCGDFNSPEKEFEDGAVVCWGGRRDADGVVRPRGRSGRWQRQHRAEESVLLGLSRFDLGDAFRAIHGYGARAYSYVARHRDTVRERRFDHVFASRSLRPVAARYLTTWLSDGLSDHAPLAVAFAPEPLGQTRVSPSPEVTSSL
jgi:exonuclease III